MIDSIDLVTTGISNDRVVRKTKNDFGESLFP